MPIAFPGVSTGITDVWLALTPPAQGAPEVLASFHYLPVLPHRFGAGEILGLSWPRIGSS